MKKVVFESKDRVGTIEVPDDAVLKVPKNMVANGQPEPEEPLYPIGVGIDDDKPPKEVFYPSMGLENIDDETEPLLPIL